MRWRCPFLRFLGLFWVGSLGTCSPGAFHCVKGTLQPACSSSRFLVLSPLYEVANCLLLVSEAVRSVFVVCTLLVDLLNLELSLLAEIMDR